MNVSSVPTGWSVVELASLQAPGDYTLVGGPFGSDLTQSDYVSQPGVPVIRGTNLGGSASRFVDDGFVYVSAEKADSLRRNMAFPGDLVFTQRGTLGQIAIIPTNARFEKYVISQSQMKLTPDSTRVDPRFLYHFFRTPRALQELLAQTQATGVPHINLGILKRVPILLPPMDAQRRIAEVLDRTEVLRAKRRAALALLNTLAPTLIADEFGDPIDNPKGIPTAILGSLCGRITDGTHQPPPWADSGHPFLFVSNVVSGELTFDTSKFISDDTHAELTRRCPIEVGDVLYSTVGSYGIPAVVRTSRKFAFQRHLAHIKPNPSLLDSEFLRAMLASGPVKRQADRAARGIAQKTVNLADIRKFVVFRPPLDVQRRFAGRIAAVDKLKAAQSSSLAQLDALFASLQHRAFRGEL